jgi:type IV pilus assembly protein PilV
MTRTRVFRPSIFLRGRGLAASSQHKGQRGVALLEVLIAFFVLSIGLLGLAALQIKALQFNQGSSQRSQAMIAAYEMMDRMRLNRSNVTAGNYNMGWGNSPSGSGMVSTDLTLWLDEIKNNFPDGEGTIDCDSNNICSVGVRWRDRFGANPGTDWESLAISSQI